MNSNDCPSCGEVVSVEPDCPGYPHSSGQLMYCFPRCGNVTSYVCLYCDWSFVDSLLPSHPRYDLNEMSRPKWLGGTA